MFNLSNVRSRMQKANMALKLFMASGTPVGYNAVLLKDLIDIGKDKVLSIKPIKDWEKEGTVGVYGYDLKMSNGTQVAVSYHEADKFNYEGLRFCPVEHTELGCIWNVVGQHIESKYEARINWVGFTDDGVEDDKGMIFGLIPKTNIAILLNHE